MPNRRPRVRKLAQKRDSKRLVVALSYRDHVTDSLDRVYDLGAGVRRDAALALASMPATGDLDVGAALIRSLSDSSCEVRRAVASSLGARRERRAGPALARAALTWEEPQYGPARAAAVTALLELAEPWTAQTFVLMAVHESEADAGRVRDILTRLVATGDEDRARAASDAAILALSTGKGDVCERAAEMLVWLGSGSIEPLLSISGQPGAARVPAIRALGELRDLRAAESLSWLLRDSDPDVRHAAAEALGGISDPRVAKPLIDATTDPDYHVREAALEAVQRLGPVAMVHRQSPAQPANEHPPANNVHPRSVQTAQPSRPLVTRQVEQAARETASRSPQTPAS